jgi:hypothetical protein
MFVRSCLATAGAVAAMVFVAAPASAAVIYCTGPGYPVGCVVRTAPVVVAPAPVVVAPRPVVVAPRPVVVAPRAGVGVGRPGVGVNRGGPVNRVGVR